MILLVYARKGIRGVTPEIRRIIHACWCSLSAVYHNLFFKCVQIVITKQNENLYAFWCVLQVAYLSSFFKIFIDLMFVAMHWSLILVSSREIC